MRLKIILLFSLVIIHFKSNAQKKDSITFYNLKTSTLKAIKNQQQDSVNYYYKNLSLLGKNKRFYKEYITTTTQVGHFYEGFGSFEKSIEIYENALAIAETYNDFKYSSTILVDLSQTYRIFHDYEKAIEYGKKAINRIKKDTSKTNLDYLTAALDITAAAFTENKQADSAVIYQEKSLSFLPKLDSMTLRTTIVNIGYTYMELNKLEKARIYTEHGLKLYKRLNSDYALAAIYTNLAMYGRRAKKYEYALKMFDTAIYYTQKSNYLEPYFWIYDERSKVYKQQKKFAKATEDLEKLVNIKDSVFNKEREKTAQETEARYKSAKKEKEIATQKEQLLAKEVTIKNRNLILTLLFASLLLIGILSFGVYKRNKLKQEQLQKELNLKDALATIKTQNRLQEQRLRISRDLHDNIGSQLTFIISSLDNLQYISKDLNQKLKEKINGIASFTGDTIHQLRDTIWAMNKSEISMEDLRTRILSFIEKAKIAKPDISFQHQFSVQNDIQFTSIEGMNIFRVIQEAMNNAIKYSEATVINVEAHQKEESIIFNIKDNGKGFDLNTTELGNGLANIEKRISEINGKVFVNSKINDGTIIQIICTLENLNS